MSELELLSRKLPYVYGQPKLQGVIRQSAEDFIVEEDLGFEPDGEGHHVLLFIEKRDTNTQWLAKQLARYADLPNKEIGYAGLKDRHAVTRQWFSVHMAGRDIDWQGFNSENWKILNITRHQRKLRPGYLKGNRFQITVRHVTGEAAELEQRLSLIKQQGIANYYGEQRFGFDNLRRAYDWLAGNLKIKKKSEKSILLSSLRSAIFNQLLAERLRNSCWDQAMPGDVLMLTGSHSVFVADEVDDTINLRLAQRDVLTTAPLFGKGNNLAQAQALAFEEQLLQQLPILCRQLNQAGLTMQRRALICMPEGLTWQRDEHAQSLVLRFYLPSGAYATSLLREIVDY